MLLLCSLAEQNLADEANTLKLLFVTCIYGAPIRARAEVMGYAVLHNHDKAAM